MDLSDKYRAHNPWPAQGDRQVLFIVDARNELESTILQDWIRHHRGDEGELQHSPVLLNLQDESNERAGRQLSSVLPASPETILAPLRVAWRPVEGEGRMALRLRNLLLGDPRRPNPRRARKILAQSPECMHLVIGEPDSLDNLRQRFSNLHPSSRSTAGNQEFAEFVARQAGLVLDIAERRLRGSRYKVPRQVAASLLASPVYNQAVDQLASDTGTDRDRLITEAREYMDEMVSVPNSLWLDVYARFNTFCLGLGYEQDIIYDQKSLEKLRQVVSNHPSMLLWTHKTYLDGMVLPKLLYDNDFPMPHLFGGANMNFPGLGYLLHRAGAIFIKRSFRDNNLYKTTLRHYIGYLMEKRFPMSWAFEGTRSRLGKLMPPRYGLLKYVLEACHATDARNIHIVPISISYDLIRDVEEYATEQTGRGKGAETLRWFIGYIRSLSRPMGKIYLDIGEPVVLERAPQPDDSLALSKIAFQVAVEANHVTPITFPSLVTMSLLGAAPRALTEQEVIADIRALLRWAEERQLHISSDFNRAFADKMEGLLDIMINENLVTRYDEGPEVVYGIALDQHPVASYYRNTIIHFFVNKAIIELALLKAGEQSGADALEAFWKEVDHLRDLFKFEFFYAPTEEFHRQIRQELQRYDEDWEKRLTGTAIGRGQLLNQMAPLVAHVTLLTYAEAYSVVADLLARTDTTASLEEDRCISDALKLGRQSYLQRRISSEASIGRILFGNAFKMMDSRGLTDSGDPVTIGRRMALSQELRDILQRIDIIRAIATSVRSSQLKQHD